MFPTRTIRGGRPNDLFVFFDDGSQQGWSGKDLPAPFKLISDNDPLCAIEGGFPEDRDEAWKRFKDRLQLVMYQQVTPVFAWLTWPHPSPTGRGRGHAVDETIRFLTIRRLATQYEYDLHVQPQQQIDKEIENGISN